MAKQAQATRRKYQNRNKAYESEGAKVRVSVLAVKKAGRIFVHLGGCFKYDPSASLSTAFRKGDMCHQSGFAFPANGKAQEYVFPREFAERLVVQAAELKDSFEVEILGPADASAPVATPAPAVVPTQAVAPTTEPFEEDEDEDDASPEDEDADE